LNTLFPSEIYNIYIKTSKFSGGIVKKLPFTIKKVSGQKRSFKRVTEKGAVSAESFIFT